MDHANSVFGAKIEEWLRTLRKKNAAVVLATQSLAEIANSLHRDVILESCPTKLYLPNAEATNAASRELYRRFGLSDRQTDIIAEATPKRHYYYVSGGSYSSSRLGLPRWPSSVRAPKTTFCRRDE